MRKIFTAVAFVSMVASLACASMWPVSGSGTPADNSITPAKLKATGTPDNSMCPRWDNTGGTPHFVWTATAGVTAYDNLTGRPTINGVTLADNVLDNAANYPAGLLRTTGDASGLSGLPTLISLGGDNASNISKGALGVTYIAPSGMPGRIITSTGGGGTPTWSANGYTLPASGLLVNSNGNIYGNAATATRLAATGTQCDNGTSFAIGTDNAGNAICVPYIYPGLGGVSPNLVFGASAGDKENYSRVVAIGSYTFERATSTLSDSLAIGYGTFPWLLGGKYNTAIGFSAGNQLGVNGGAYGSSDNNTFVGALSGRMYRGGNNTHVGAMTMPNSGEMNNTLVLGYAAAATLSNQASFGNTDVDTFLFGGQSVTRDQIAALADNNDAFITRHWTGSGYLKSDGTADTPSGTISGPATVTAGHIATWTDNVTLADSGYAAPDQALSITDNVTHHDGTFTGTLTAAGWSSSATDNTHTLIVNNTGTVDNAYRQANGIWTQSDNTVHMISSDNTSEAIVAVFNRILSRIAWKLSGGTFDNVVVPMLPSGNGAVVTGFKGIFYDNSAGTISTAATDNVTVEVDYCLGASCTNIDNTTLTGAAPADITIAGTATIPTNADIRYRFTAVNTSGKFSIAVVGRWQ